MRVDVYDADNEKLDEMFQLKCNKNSFDSEIESRFWLKISTKSIFDMNIMLKVQLSGSIAICHM